VTRLITIAGALLLSSARFAAAHPGHGVAGGSNGLGHYLTEPIHLIAGAGALALAGVLVRWRARDRARLQTSRVTN